MMYWWDPKYLLFVSPALILALWAQWRVKVTYATAQQQPAPLSGAAAARHVLDSAGLNDVQIEEIPGQLSDHYDPRDKVLRLSTDVFRSNSLAAVGIACHEAGHALQDATNYALMGIRNAAVPAANFGSNAGVLLIFVGAIFSARIPALGILIPIGIAAFSCVVLFQLVNLPVEFNASARAKHQLVALGIVDQEGMKYVNAVLNAAAWTYVAGTLQSIMILLYYISRFSGDRR